MSWVPILALAALTFVGAVFLLKLPRPVWMLFAAGLLFGLAGYAMQGSPGLPAAAAVGTVDQSAQTGELLVQARREFYPEGQSPSRFVVTADAFARRGQFDQAASFLRNAVLENPNDGEAWLALGNALVEHAEGQLTAAALYAYSRAEQVQPGSPAPTYFVGLAFLRAGQPGQTRAVWAELLAKAPEDAPWRPALAERLARLEALMGIAQQSPPAGNEQ
ncbi:MAG: tetratricopeptide repeat protein [Erythrobacter sp.]|jgi:cytochrome c-type biogenesis protein CcmH